MTATKQNVMGITYIEQINQKGDKPPPTNKTNEEIGE